MTKRQNDDAMETALKKIQALEKRLKEDPGGKYLVFGLLHLEIITRYFPPQKISTPTKHFKSQHTEG